MDLLTECGVRPAGVQLGTMISLLLLLQIKLIDELSSFDQLKLKKIMN